MKNDLIQLISNNEEILFLGLGNKFRSDDRVGLYIVDELSDEFNVLKGGKNPEKHINKIKEIGPDVLIIVDSVDHESKPGSVVFTDLNDVVKKPVSSHRMPIKIFIEILKNDLVDLKTYLIGIQPLDLSIGENISPKIKETAEMVIELIKEIKN